MVSIDGTDITGATIDGEDVSEITVDGDTVWTARPDSVVSRPDDTNTFGGGSQLGVLIETSQHWPSIGARLSQSVSGQTRAYLYRVSDNDLIDDIDVSNKSSLDTFTFDDVSLVSGTQYTIVVDAEGADYTVGYSIDDSYPITSPDGNLQIVDNAIGSEPETVNSNTFNILEVGNVGF